MFRVQRAGGGDNPQWKTICTNPSEEYARQTYDRQLRMNSSGRFRLLDPQDKVLAEAKAPPLFERSERDDEFRPSMETAPAPAAPRTS